jgi:CRISPR-associated protein Cas1
MPSPIDRSPPRAAPSPPAPESVFANQALHEAWRRVRANGGGAGGDGQTLEAFAARLDRNLAALARDLRTGRYRPGPLRRVAVGKPDGGRRELAIPTVRDRVAQTALLLALTPLLDRRMSGASFAYRPGRSVAQALAAARAEVARGRRMVVDADIAKFFDNVPHAPLLAELGIWLDEPRLLALIGLWLRSFGAGGLGLPQGAPLSPLLANLWLHPLDRLLAAAGIAAVRYADDFVLLCADRAAAERALAVVQAICAERGLLLHADKTRIADATDIRFLGEPLWPAPATALAAQGAASSAVVLPQRAPRPAPGLGRRLVWWQRGERRAP